MTLDNCKKLLAHYEAVGRKAEAEDMRAAIARKGVTEPKTKK